MSFSCYKKHNLYKRTPTQKTKISFYFSKNLFYVDFFNLLCVFVLKLYILLVENFAKNYKKFMQKSLDISFLTRYYRGSF